MLVVKQYRTPAASQTLILAAFEEDGWPRRIDDPLPVVPGIVAKDRLRTAIRDLNRNQQHPAIRFRGDGTGVGIIWELTVENLPPQTS
jgi:hypothetical protein